jgi:hypothetical protein
LLLCHECYAAGGGELLKEVLNIAETGLVIVVCICMCALSRNACHADLLEFIGKYYFHSMLERSNEA